MPTAPREPAPIVPSEGWGVLHLFFRINHHVVDTLPTDAGDALVRILDDSAGELQLHLFSVPGHKADIMLVALDEDLGRLRRLQTQLLTSSAGPALDLTWSYFSLTEGSEYTSTPEQYREELGSKGVVEPDLDRRVAEFAERMAKYTDDKLHPNMPDWPVACFYPMSHRRSGEDNWFTLPFEERKRLMHDHGRSGRAYTGKVIQLVAGSTGLDDWEWGVTLFAHDVTDLKRIVYQLRYDEASARFAEFGPFIVGLRRSATELVREVGLVRS